MELDCGIARKRITDWLNDELALAREGRTWLFAAGVGTCCITAEKLESRKLGAVDLERTSVRVEGDELAVEAFMHLFTLRFMSAGG